MLGRLGFVGRIMAIVLLALLALTTLSATLAFLRNRQPADAIDWAALPARAAAVVELLEHGDAQQRALILKAVNSEAVLTSIVLQRPAAEPGAQRLPWVEWIVQQFLKEVGTRDVIAVLEPVRLSGRSWRDFRFGQVRLFAREPLKVAIALHGGGWVVFETRVEISPNVLGFPPGFMIGIFGALVGMAALLAIAREAKPLRDLAVSVSKFAGTAVPQPVEPRGAPEVAALIASINDMQTRTAALLKGRTILLGAISHDLKTFITRLRLRVEAMPTAEQRAKATRDLEGMTALIDDGLAVARGGMVSGRREVLELRMLLADDIADRPGSRIGFAKHLPAIPARLFGDPTALRRLFDNLIGNAVQHGTTVQICMQQDWQHIIVLIDDDGPGIPEAERAAVFEPFYRLDRSRSSATGGSGLGLAIARQIVEAHAGSIGIDASPLGGTRIIVRLPAA